MNDDLTQSMREQVAASTRKIGMSFEDARNTTRYSQELLNQYRSADRGVSGVAAFRIDAYLTESANQSMRESELSSIAEALRLRISQRTLALSDLRIGLALHSHGAFDHQEVASLVAEMKGVDDFSVASEARRLLPIIGADFLQDYLSSTQLFETGGMGGPQRPLIREMAEEAVRNFTPKALGPDLQPHPLQSSPTMNNISKLGIKSSPVISLLYAFGLMVMLCANDRDPSPLTGALATILILASPLAFALMLAACVGVIRRWGELPSRVILAATIFTGATLTGYFLLILIGLWRSGPINPG